MPFEVLQMAFAALRANVLRSLLTMLGIVIGVAAVIAMIALGDGAKASVRERITKLGTTTLQIDAQWVRVGGIQTNVRKRVTIDDVKAIEERAPHVLAVTRSRTRTSSSMARQERERQGRRRNARTSRSSSISCSIAVACSRRARTSAASASSCSAPAFLRCWASISGCDHRPRRAHWRNAVRGHRDAAVEGRGERFRKCRRSGLHPLRHGTLSALQDRSARRPLCACQE